MTKSGKESDFGHQPAHPKINRLKSRLKRTCGIHKVGFASPMCTTSRSPHYRIRKHRDTDSYSVTVKMSGITQVIYVRTSLGTKSFGRNFRKAWQVTVS